MFTDSGAGQGILANSINQSGDRIRESLGGMYGRIQQNQESSRLLHPATAKWLQKIVSGEMSPAEAAAAAHNEIDGGTGGGMPPPQKLGGAGEQGRGGGMNQAALTPEAQSLINNPEQQSAQPRFTQRDLADAYKVSQTAAPQMRANTAYNAEQGRNYRSDNTEAGRNDRYAESSKIKREKLKQDSEMHADKMQLEYDKLDAAMQRVLANIKGRKSAANNKDSNKNAIESLKADARTIAGIRSYIANENRNLTTLIASGSVDPDTVKDLARRVNAAQDRLEFLETAYENQMEAFNARSGGGVSPSGVPPEDAFQKPGQTRPQRRQEADQESEAASNQAFGDAARGADPQGKFRPTQGNLSGTPPIAPRAPPPIDTSTPVRVPRDMKFNVKNKMTGKVRQLTSDEIDEEVQLDLGGDEKRWLNEQTITGPAED